MVTVEYQDGSTEKKHLLQLICELCFSEKKPVGYIAAGPETLGKLKGIINQLLDVERDQRE